MSPPPLVSVVIPSYNRLHCLPRAIASVVAQSHRALEIIIVDDGSTDGTAEWAAGFACPVPFRFHPLERNMGAAAARNRGIELAEGTYVAFLDSDDTWHPDKITRQLAAIAAGGPAFGAAYTGIASLTEAGQPCGISRATEAGDIRLALMNHNVVGSTSCALVRRDLLRAVGGFEPNLRSCQDWELWVRLSALTRFACVPELLTTLYIAPDGRITSSGRNRLTGHLYMYRTHLRPHFRDGTVDPGLFTGMLGEIFVQMGRPDYGARLLRRNWRAKPRSAKRLALYLTARAGVGKARYFAVAEFITRLEERLRPTAIRAPAPAAPAEIRAAASVTSR
ncbi:MAG TPA: glycosyltransferase family A protein [Aliidongia sp.]|uniref:glycosyltransferase family 2 protein n=1 Tax=Aliidongia sp. TaxID=1914230 RepID=UPI002DDD223D|nr:glycosyltransferase family A protein [Aliidongia sp.]HEV2673900.1 glycosyltransferase family A protein [Aliidongia sp.]